MQPAKPRLPHQITREIRALQLIKELSPQEKISLLHPCGLPRLCYNLTDLKKKQEVLFPTKEEGIMIVSEPPGYHMEFLSN